MYWMRFDESGHTPTPDILITIKKCVDHIFRIKIYFKYSNKSIHIARA